MQVVPFIRDDQQEQRSPGTISVTVDAKGRISIPIGIRKSFALQPGRSLELLYDLNEGVLLVILKEAPDAR